MVLVLRVSFLFSLFRSSAHFIPGISSSIGGWIVSSISMKQRLFSFVIFHHCIAANRSRMKECVTMKWEQLEQIQNFHIGWP